MSFSSGAEARCRWRRQKRAVHAGIAVAIAFVFKTFASAATLTWTGAAGDGNINTAGNWSPAQAPAKDDVLIFAGSTSLAPQRASNLSLGAINFASGAAAFTIGGAGVYTLTTATAVTNNSTSLQTINNSITVGVAQTWNAAAGALSFGGAINLASFNLTIDGSYNTTITGVISGAGGGLTKTGTGTLTISGTAKNTFTGATTVNAGTVVLAKTAGLDAIKGTTTIGDGVGTDIVRLGASNQFNTGSITINSSGLLDLNNFSDTIGALTFNGGSVTTGTGTLTLGGDITSNVSSVSASISGLLDLGGSNRTFTIADGSAADDFIISANINSGSRTLTKAGAGTLVLSGSNLFSDISITGGVLSVRSNNALGGTTPTVSAGAQLQLQGSVSIADPLTLNGSGIANDGALRSVSGNNTVTGGISLGSASAIGSDAGTLTLSGAVSLGGKALDLVGAGNTSISGIISGTGSLTMDGAGVLTLSGANTYSGGSVINSGTVIINTGASLGSSAVAATINGGTLEVASTFTAARNFTLGSSASTILVDPNQTFSVPTVFSGTGALTKTGSGTLLLSGVNTYTGGTNVNAGTLQLGASNSLADSGAMTVNGGTFDLQSFSDTVGPVALKSGSIIGAGTLTGSSYTVESGSISAKLAGVGGLVKNTSGTVFLSTANTYSGGTTINAGTLQIVSNSLGAVAGGLTINAGTLEATTTFSTTRVITLGNAASTIMVDPSQTYTLTSAVGGSGALTKTGSGTLALSGTNTYSGGTTINAGTVLANSSSSLGASGAAATINAGTLEVSATYSSARNFILADTASTIMVDPSQTFTVGNIISGSGNLNKSGTGALVLNGVDTYTGGTYVTAGSLSLGAGASLASTTLNVSPGASFTGNSTATLPSTLALTANGSVTLSAATRTVSSLDGAGTGVVILNGTNLTASSGSYAGVLQNGASAGSLTKAGTGTLNLTGANTFTGSTTVNGGTLVAANGSGSALGSTSGITVNSGGTLLLGASDQINNTAGMTLAGGTFAKGNFSEGATNAVGLGALTLSAAGSHLDFGTGTVGTLSFLSFNANNYNLVVDNWTGTINAAGGVSTDRLVFDADQSANLSYFSFTGFGSGAAQFSLGGGFYEVVPVTPVPEPATYLAGVLACGAAVLHLRRKRSAQKLSSRGSGSR